MKTPEAYEKEAICKYLDSIGAWYFKPMTMGYGKSGVSDIVACIDGQFWALEVKREGKEPTAIQARRGKEIQNAGGCWAAGTAKVVIDAIMFWVAIIK